MLVLQRSPAKCLLRKSLFSENYKKKTSHHESNDGFLASYDNVLTVTDNALTRSSRPRKDFNLDLRHLSTIVPVCTYRRGALNDVTTVVALSRHQSEPLASVLVLAELGLEALLLLSGCLVSSLLLVLSLDSRGHWPAG